MPFCEVKCTYCHFAIDPQRPDDARQDRYLRAVLAEMGAADPGRADTLYFGGGTPSLMSAERLAHIVSMGRERFRLPPDAEVTVEANPRDLDEAGYRALRAAGATRISLGVQSFDDGVLAQMGRLHSAAGGFGLSAHSYRAGRRRCSPGCAARAASTSRPSAAATASIPSRNSGSPSPMPSRPG